MKNIFLIPICLLLIFAGCRLGPTYTKPPVYVPENWKAPSKEVQAPIVCNWWEVFNDPVLNGLEWHAVENNPNLGISVQRIVEARALAEVSGAALYPQLTINPLYTNTGQLFKIFVPQGLVPAGSNLPSVFRIHQFQYFLPINLNYEVDLWGKIRNQYDSAIFNFEASVWDFRAAMLTLTSDLASTYFQLRGLDTQIEVLNNTLELRKKELSLAESRYTKGIATRQDFTSAEVNLANAETSLFDAQRIRTLQENMIATLLGMPASLFCLPPNPLKEQPSEIPAGIPSQIMRQRPDIAEADWQAASENALIGAAYADFFPTLSLSAVSGYLSPDLKHFLTHKSRYWQFGASSSQMVFDGGRDEGNLEAAWARFRQASFNYQQVVLTAFQEVEDALNNLEYQAKEHKSLLVAVRASRETASLSLQRYRQGITNYLEVTVNDRIRLEAELNYANTLSQQYVSTVQLIKALGGSWCN
jgi:multidrug efflux system outer membrane protein